MTNRPESHPSYEDELTRIVHSQLWSEEGRPIEEVDEHITFDVMLDFVRQRIGIFAEIEVSAKENARWIRVHPNDAPKAKWFLNEADNRGTLQDMINERTEWDW